MNFYAMRMNIEHEQVLKSVVHVRWHDAMAQASVAVLLYSCGRRIYWEKRSESKYDNKNKKKQQQQQW